MHRSSASTPTPSRPQSVTDSSNSKQLKEDQAGREELVYAERVLNRLAEQ